MLVPEFETLPTNEVRVSAVAQGTSSIVLSWKLESSNETVVLSYNAREIYRGMDVSDWAKEEVEELAGMYMLTGYKDGSFRPMQHLSRSEAAALIFRLNKLIRILEEQAMEGNQTSKEADTAKRDKTI